MTDPTSPTAPPAVPAAAPPPPRTAGSDGNARSVLPSTEEKAAPNPDRRRARDSGWAIRWTVTIGALALGLLSLWLGFAPPPQRSIRGSIEASQLEMRLATAHVQENIGRFSAITAGGVTALQAIAVQAIPKTVRAPRGQLSVSVGTRGGVVRLKRLELPSGIRVAVRRDAESGEATLLLWCDSAPCGPARALVEAAGRVAIAWTGAGERVVTLNDVGTLELHLDLRSSTIALGIPSGAATALADQVAVSALGFERMDRKADYHRAMDRRRSSVVGGELVFEALGERPYPLRRGQRLRLGLERGLVETIVADSASLRVAFDARVRSLSTGEPEEPIDLMPTRFALLAASQERKQLLSFFLGALSLLLGAARFLMSTR